MVDFTEFLMNAQELKPNEVNFKDSNVIYEQKIDGGRHLFVNGLLYSKRGVERSKRYPHIVKELEILRGDNCLVLDGEVWVEGGVLALNSSANWDKAKFCVFDILKFNGEDMREKPLIERLELLHNILSNPLLRHIHLPKTYDDFKTAWADVEKNDYEGLMVKNLGMKYEAGKRSWAWVKVKRKLCADVEILGHEEGKNKGTFLCRTKKGTDIRVSGNSMATLDYYNKHEPKEMEVNYMYETADGKYFQPTFSKFIE